MSENREIGQIQPADAEKKAATVRYDQSFLTDDDIYLFNEGSHFRLYEKMGARIVKSEGLEGVYFAVWAPNAYRVCVMGSFNGWNMTSHSLRAKGQSGIWEGVIPGIKAGETYKYHMESRYSGYRADKADPFAIYAEAAPETASVIWNLDYDWSDAEWIKNRGAHNNPASPLSIYELHLGSWMRGPGEDHQPTYREIAPKLAEYLERTGFTHVELMPVMEHPFYGSWGYQCLGYFAPTSRYGRPQDFMYLIDLLHQHGIGVILDWVPSHFPTDGHGLGFFDGTHLFEHADPQKGVHPDWTSYIFNFGRNEVQSFLISSALFWLDKYHADGLRMDAVASMIYLDYSRGPTEWAPNKYGGRENLEAIAFLRRLNEGIKKTYPQVLTIAEESTAWPMVSRPAYVGGLGFDMKWDLGWMHDTLDYLSRGPIHRKYHHDKLTFRMFYSFKENYLLPLSHDEVVHGKGSLLAKMPGDDWQKFANLRLLFGYMYAQPGKKLLFMGGDFGQRREWNHDESLNWHLLEYSFHSGLQRWVADLNRVYRNEPALHELDFDPSGFDWIDCNDSQQSTLSLIRKGRQNRDVIIVALNFTPVPRHNYQLGVPETGFWREILNSDAKDYEGSGQGNLGGLEAVAIPFHGKPWSLNLTLPPLSVIFFKNEREKQ